MSEVDGINSVLSQIRNIKSQIESKGVDTPVTGTQQTDFVNTLKKAVDTVNEAQANSSAMKTRYEKGDPTVNLADVMLASQKAGLAFEAAVQVRNRMVQAYQEIMNMPV
jgi:flagellar hook-basal body complex protein FliE